MVAWYLFHIAAFCLLMVIIYGWLPFLIRGVARRRKGAGGGWQLAVAGVWVALLATWFIWTIAESSGRARTGTWISVLAVIGATVWVPLAIWGVARWRRKKSGGKPMAAVAGLWFLLVVSLITCQVASWRRDIARYATKTFDAGTYKGAVAEMEFPYTGDGNVNLFLFPQDKKPCYQWHVCAVGTNRMTIPAGDYDTARLDFALGNVQMSCVSDNPFSVAQGEVFVVPGGFPLTASIHAHKSGDDQIYLSAEVTDSAGNRMTVEKTIEKLGFEAVTPEGASFWRGDFEYG